MQHVPVFVIALAALVFWSISVQRSLAGMAENINNAMIQISIQISSEWDALTSLLELTKGYAPYEHGTIMETMNERCPITKGSSPEVIFNQENMIEETIWEIREVAEEYADLKADPAYLKTMDAVQRYGNMVKTSKLIYNDSAAKLNHAIHMFPASMIAGILGFSSQDYFEKEIVIG